MVTKDATLERAVFIIQLLIFVTTQKRGKENRNLFSSRFLSTVAVIPAISSKVQTKENSDQPAK